VNRGDEQRAVNGGLSQSKRQPLEEAHGTTTREAANIFNLESARRGKGIV
jgi:hypothetical protein